jgi:multiple sugar transport system substrate-binding protein
MKEHPEFQVFIKGLQFPSISFPIPQWTQVDQEVFQSALNQSVSGKISTEEALKMVETKGNAILKQK